MSLLTQNICVNKSHWAPNRNRKHGGNHGYPSTCHRNTWWQPWLSFHLPPQHMVATMVILPLATATHGGNHGYPATCHRNTWWQPWLSFHLPPQHMVATMVILPLATATHGGNHGYP